MLAKEPLLKLHPHLHWSQEPLPMRRMMMSMMRKKWMMITPIWSVSFTKSYPLPQTHNGRTGRATRSFSTQGPHLEEMNRESTGPILAIIEAMSIILSWVSRLSIGRRMVEYSFARSSPSLSRARTSSRRRFQMPSPLKRERLRKSTCPVMKKDMKL